LFSARSRSRAGACCTALQGVGPAGLLALCRRTERAVTSSHTLVRVPGAERNMCGRDGAHQAIRRPDRREVSARGLEPNSGRVRDLASSNDAAAMVVNGATDPAPGSNRGMSSQGCRDWTRSTPYLCSSARCLRPAAEHDARCQRTANEKARVSAGPLGGEPLTGARRLGLPPQPPSGGVIAKGRRQAA
jgi:hypothetical protein